MQMCSTYIVFIVYFKLMAYIVTTHKNIDKKIVNTFKVSDLTTLKVIEAPILVQ
jgi:hypothetical protein